MESVNSLLLPSTYESNEQLQQQQNALPIFALFELFSEPSSTNFMSIVDIEPIYQTLNKGNAGASLGFKYPHTVIHEYTGTGCLASGSHWFRVVD